MNVRVAIEQWAPEYGAPLDGDGFDPSTAFVDVEAEVPAAAWAPRAAGAAGAPCVLFVDGVRRVDARAWLTDANGDAHPAILGSYAAGVVRCDGAATLVAAEVDRGLFTAHPDAADLLTAHGTWRVGRASASTPEALSIALQVRMGATEAQVVGRVAAEADLIVVDGPLRAGISYPGCSVGYVKTHSTGYLPPEQEAIVGRLGAGERTPVFSVTQPMRSAYSWYLRLPGASGHPWAGIVRCEVEAGGRQAREAIALAELASATLPRFASSGHKDPRAPQNLIPIGGLEQRLRHLLGDRELLFRGLVRAAA